MRSSGPAQVRGKRAGGDDPVGGLDPVLVEANHDRPVQLSARRSAEHNALGAGLEMVLELGPRRLGVPEIDHRGHAKIGPRHFAPASRPKHLSAGAVDTEAVLVERDLAVESPWQGGEP